MRMLFDWNKQKTLCVMAAGAREPIHVTGSGGSTALQYATCPQIAGRIGKVFIFDKVNDPVIVLVKKLHYKAGELCAEIIYAARPYREGYTVSIGIMSVMPRLSVYLAEKEPDRKPILVPESGENFPLYLGECLIPAREPNYFYLLTETEVRNFGRYDERLVADRQQLGELVYRWTLRPYAEMTVVPTRT